MGELEAFRDLYAAAPPGIGAKAKEIDDALCLRLEPLPTVTMFNRVLGLGIEQTATDEQLDEALEFLDGVRACVAVVPEAEGLVELLVTRGFVRDRGWTKFTRPTGDPPTVRTELHVERDESGEAFAEAAQRGFEVPEPFRPWLTRLAGRDGWQCFVGYDGETAAAAGALFVAGKVGWTGIGATVPEHRGKGGQGALLAARIRAAAEAGCEVVVTETGEPVDGLANGSYRNILRAGFEPVYVRANYLAAIADS